MKYSGKKRTPTSVDVGRQNTWRALDIKAPPPSECPSCII